MNAPDDDWNYILLDGYISPGTVKLSGYARKIAWDVKDADGQKGATTTRKGEPNKGFTADFYLVDDPTTWSDFLLWDFFEALCLQSVASDPPTAMTVVHPDLNRNGLTAVVLDEIGEFVPDGKGGAHIIVKFIEYRPKQPQTGNSAQQSPAAETEGDKRVREAEEEYKEVQDEGDNLW